MATLWLVPRTSFVVPRTSFAAPRPPSPAPSLHRKSQDLLGPPRFSQEVLGSPRTPVSIQNPNKKPCKNPENSRNPKKSQELPATLVGNPRAKRTTMLPTRVFDIAATACRRLFPASEGGAASGGRTALSCSSERCFVVRAELPRQAAGRSRVRPLFPPKKGGKQAPACRRGFIKNTSGEHSCAFRARNSQKRCLGFPRIS